MSQRSYLDKGVLQELFDQKDPNAKKEDFQCPVCGSGSYLMLREHNGIFGPGGASFAVGYECNGCSIRFGDPRKFKV